MIAHNKKKLSSYRKHSSSDNHSNNQKKTEEILAQAHAASVVHFMYALLVHGGVALQCTKAAQDVQETVPFGLLEPGSNVGALTIRTWFRRVLITIMA